MTNELLVVYVYNNTMDRAYYLWMNVFVRANLHRKFGYTHVDLVVGETHEEYLTVETIVRLGKISIENTIGTIKKVHVPC